MKKIYTFKVFMLLLAAGVFALAACNKEEDESLFTGSDNAIAAFTLVKDGVTLKAAVSPNALVITAPERLSLEGAVATVTLSENATIEPDPAAITGWDAAQTFTVTAYNGTKNTYAYSVERHLVSREGDVVLLTQDDVDAFAAELDADQLTGVLTVGAATGQDTVYSLAPLAGRLQIITGGITINATYAGEDLTGLADNVEKTGDLVIRSKKLRTVSFPKLAAVRLNMNFDQATAIRTLDFPNLTTVDKGLQIYYVDSLASMNFPKLQQVIESMTIQGRSSGTQNLQAIEFPALQTVGGSFTLSYWREMPEVNLPELTSVGTAFTLTYLNKAESIAMPKLKSTAAFALSYCAALMEIDFRALETTGAMSLSNCAALTSIDFSTLKTVNGALSPNLAALAEVNFPALETVTGGLSFATSATLTALQFPALKSAGSLTIPNAANLTTLQFPALEAVTSILSLSLPTITSLDAFSALKTAGTLTLNGLTNLTAADVSGMKINRLELSGASPIGLTLTGDDEFSGALYISSPPSGTTDLSMTVEGFKTVGAIQIAENYYTAIDFPWLERVTGLLYFSSGSAIQSINLPNLVSAGGLQIASCAALTTLNLPELTEITGYTSGTATLGSFTYAVTSSNITALTLPKLQSVVGDVSITGLVAARKLATIDFPALKSLTGTLTITGTSNTTFKDLSGFSTLTSAGGVTIANFTQLKDFSPLQHLFPALPADKWAVGGCGYSPTHQNMLDGNYSN